MKRTLFLALTAFMINTAYAQEDTAEFDVVLPDEAQKCVLPASPDKIPDEATLDELKLAKAQVGAFQEKIGEFRECLQQAEENPDNTAGNRQAIVASYNYSVEMEERVATRFNDAVREYKERQASAGG